MSPLLSDGPNGDNLFGSGVILTGRCLVSTTAWTDNLVLRSMTQDRFWSDEI
jgi:hypothetical protein